MHSLLSKRHQALILENLWIFLPHQRMRLLSGNPLHRALLSLRNQPLLIDVRSLRNLPHHVLNETGKRLRAFVWRAKLNALHCLPNTRLINRHRWRGRRYRLWCGYGSGSVLRKVTSRQGAHLSELRELLIRDGNLLAVNDYVS